MKKISLFIKEEDLKYIEDLAVALERSTAWIIRAMLEYAIEKHKNGDFEF